MVLLIEPDAVLQNTYANFLRASGHEVAIAAGAQQALAAIEGVVPKIIVLELQLHAHSGVEFLHELRSYSEWQHIPVILNTFVPPADLASFKSAFDRLGIVGHLYKPQANLSALSSIIGQYKLATV